MTVPSHAAAVLPTLWWRVLHHGSTVVGELLVLAWFTGRVLVVPL
ncbi:hypothetical protein [Dactylosporangium sp. NPDC050588]